MVVKYSSDPRPIEGASCHPSHFEAPPPPGMSEEQIAKNWEGYNKGKKIDPRAIDNHFKFKPGHEPGFDEPESGWKYVDVEFTGEPTDPDQRDMLKGGPPVNMDCERCGDQLHLVGEMSTWDVMHQDGVSLANEENIDPSRRKELEDEKIVILACPSCKAKYQWLAEMLPRD